MADVMTEIQEKRYSESHEWATIDGEVATVGVSNYAQEELGSIVFVELPEIGATVTAGEEAVVLESTKAAADVYSPLSGEVLAVNHDLEEASGLVNDSAEEKGWLFKLKLSNAAEWTRLMDVNGYKEFIG